MPGKVTWNCPAPSVVADRKYTDSGSITSPSAKGDRSTGVGGAVVKPSRSGALGGALLTVTVTGLAVTISPLGRFVPVTSSWGSAGAPSVAGPEIEPIRLTLPCTVVELAASPAIAV